MSQLRDILHPDVTISQVRERLKNNNKGTKEKIVIIKEEMPSYVEDILKKANQALKGELLLPGTEGVPKFVGTPPSWFNKMNDDNEFLWQLNRMEHWMYLAEAYAYTGEEKYVLKILDEFYDWNKQVKLFQVDYFAKPIDFFVSVHPMRILECGIRLYKTWPFIIEYLIDTDLLTDDFLEEYIKSIYIQAKLIATHSPVFWPDADHNHYIMECLGLLTTSLMFPEFKESDDWRALALKELNRCSQNQLTEIGGQIEGCPSYHNGCMFWFGMVIVNAKKYGFEVSEEYKQLYKNNLDFSLHSMRPTGKTYPLGDSHANNLAIMSAVFGYFSFDDLYWLNHLASFLPISEIQEVAFSYVRYCLDPETFKREMGQIKAVSSERLLPTVLFNQDIGQAFIRTSWDKAAHAVAFTCQSPVQNAHSHIDLLSFEYIALGKNIICDPGIFTYRDDSTRKLLKSTASHSTLMINNQDLFEYINSWSYGPQEKGELLELIQDDLATTITGYHLCYSPTKVIRSLSLVENSFLLVYDKVIDREENSLVSRTFHMDYLDIVLEEDKVIALSDNINTLVIDSSGKDPQILEGILSDINDVSRESKRLVYETKDEEEFLTLIYPYEVLGDRPEVAIRKKTANEYEVKVNDSFYEVEIKENKLKIR